MNPSSLFESAEQAAAPEVNSKKENRAALTSGEVSLKIEDAPPVNALKKVTNAQTLMTALAADATDSVNTVKIGGACWILG